MTTFQHLAEHPVGIGAALVSALGVLVIHPCVDDHFAGRVVAEEQPVLLEELGAEPVLMVFAERVALPVFGSRRILWNHLKRQLGNRCQSLGGALLGESNRVFLLEPFDLPSDCFKLDEE